jgi:hypothetical protein
MEAPAIRKALSSAMNKIGLRHYLLKNPITIEQALFTQRNNK